MTYSSALTSKPPHVSSCGVSSMAEAGGITVDQVSNWMINARVRVVPKLKAQARAAKRARTGGEEL